MRILYVTIDQHVPGTLGGSVHVQAVAEGLAALGHEVHVAAQMAGGAGSATPRLHDCTSTTCGRRSDARRFAGCAAGTFTRSRSMSAQTWSSSATTTSAAK